MIAVRVMTGLLLLTLGAAVPAAAQTDARLVAALKLAQDGQADSARAVTRALLTRIPASDTLYPQVLFTAASVSATAPEMEKALRRIIVEYPSSEWVDDALLRLAQIDYAGGDVGAAAEKLERLRTDFPNSALLAPASLWAARSYFELRNRTAACKWLDDGRARAGADVETINQLAFYAQRCAPGAQMADAPTMDTVKLAKGDSVAVPKPGRPAAGAKDTGKTAATAAAKTAPAAKDAAKPAPTAAPSTNAAGNAAAKPAPAPSVDATAKPAPAPSAEAAPTPAPAPSADTTTKPAPAPSAGATTTPAPAATPKPAAGAFRLQLAAMKTAEQANELVTALKAKGIDADVTVDAGFHKVRTGRYPTLAAATAAIAVVARKAGSTPFAVRAGN